MEAISIYASQGDMAWIASILEERGERIKNSVTNKATIDQALKIISSLFIDRKTSYNVNDAISIGPLSQSLFGPINSSNSTVSIRLVRYVEENIESDLPEELGGGYRRRRVIEDSEASKVIDFQIGVEIRVGEAAITLPLEGDRLYRSSMRHYFSIGKFQYIRTKNLDPAINATLWDNIVLTAKEEVLVDSLRIVEPNLDRITFVNNDPNRGRSIVVKLRNSNVVVPLRSMGDGINRIFTIVLALVNADAGYLLVDEFENGLHYSVQEALWKIIFKVTTDLNVQVFATTHSQDCINSFEEALQQTIVKGKLFRLENVNNEVKMVDFSENELKIATDNLIETR